ncbi:acyl transferase domain-containing protein [Spinactinospora alkalitolerans]|uniref:Acyl transferase domain-containing protein n=1 Tax=Spinactinospora alkalitolerans TaxID=687207 RepID=A0A852TUQ1_9ACTN|nr:type I polyketide synthase [Spinactinospora alkalitolerans]NYE45650.1 acyl transferase domain-containing protein [Spinactinospora alkalitolerans]
MSGPDTAGRAAIVGIGARLPGGLHGPGQFWRALLKRRDTITEIPDVRWKTMADRLAEEQRPEQPWTAGVLDDIEAFDADAFGIGTGEAVEMDPQQRILLEVVVETLQDAGIPCSALAGTRAGVYVGAASFDQATVGFAPGRRSSMLTAGGSGMAVLANRISYALDLRGPSITFDTACSSSLVALHQARRDLEAGEIDAAIVAGSNVLLNPSITAAFHDGGVLASTGRCRPFDTDGDGYVRSEGVGVAVLKRHGDARADADRVYALIAGSGVNSDGRSRGLFAPNRHAQEALLRDVYDRSGIDPGEVDYVETHGTATAAGDNVEGRALAAVLGAHRDPERPLLIGSVKSNIGHLEGAAGIVNVIKTALALHHRRIPPTINHARMRPSLAKLALSVPTAPTPWPERGGSRLAGVSAFGFGGTNAHVILEGADPVPPSTGGREAQGPVLIPVSAHSRASLRGTAADWAGALTEGTDLTAVAATATHRRDHALHRAAVVAADPAEAVDAFGALAEGRPHPALVGPHVAPIRPPRVVFAFSGHGGQWAGMGERLHATMPVFAEAVAEVRSALAGRLGHQPWAPGDPMIGFAAIQHAIFTMQVGLAAVWRSWGVTPDAVVGHSLGEVAAAHVAGALSLDDAVQVLCARSALLAETSAIGGLLATELTADQAHEAIAPYSGALAVATLNGPRTTVISGTHAELARLHADLDRAGVWARSVADGVPAHSPHLHPLLPRLSEALSGLTPADTPVDFASTVTAAHTPGHTLGADYWTGQLRSPVRLHETVRALAAARPSVFVEIAPRGVLGHAIGDTLTEHDLPGDVVPAAPEDDEHTGLLVAAATLSTRGRTPTGTAPAGLPPVDLPATRWDREGAAKPGAEPAGLATRLETATTPRERRHAIQLAVRDICADITRTDPGTLPLDEEMANLGVTSVSLIEMRSRLRLAHPDLAGLSAALIYAHPTIEQLTRAIDRHLHQQEH